jgi:hypothetical protein
MSETKKIYQLVVDCDEYFLSLTEAESDEIRRETKALGEKFGCRDVLLCSVVPLELKSSKLLAVLRKAKVEPNAYCALKKVEMFVERAAIADEVKPGGGK